jgi:hypothetical protein
VGIPEGKRTFGRHRSRWKENVITELQQLGWKVLDWIDLAKDMDR